MQTSRLLMLVILDGWGWRDDSADNAVHLTHTPSFERVLHGAGTVARFPVFTDARDPPPRAAAGYLHQLRAALPSDAAIASVSGRYYAMDRDKRWERVEKAYQAIASAKGAHFHDAQAVVSDAYANKVSDEFITPTVIGDYGGIKDGDGLLSFNFRADRIRQILTALLDPAFAGFPR